MRLPEKNTAEKVRARLLGTDTQYRADVQRKGWQQYCELVRRLRNNCDYLFRGNDRIEAIFGRIVELDFKIDNVDSEVDNLGKLYAAIDSFRTDLEIYIQDLTNAIANDIKVAIQSEIISGFKGAAQPAVVSFLRSAPRILYEDLAQANTLQAVIDSWSTFKKAVQQPSNSHLSTTFNLVPRSGYAPIALDQKISEVDGLFEGRQKQIKPLLEIVGVIDQIGKNIDTKDGMQRQLVHQEETAAITERAINDYCFHDLVEHEDIKAEKGPDNNITVTLGVTNTAGRRIEKTILLVAPHNENPIDNRTTFTQIVFSRMTLLAVFQDLWITIRQEAEVSTAEQAVAPLFIATTKPEPAFFEKARNAWTQFKDMFSINRLRRSPVFAVGFALFLGLTHSGKANHQTTTTADPAPITTVAPTTTDRTNESPTLSDTPAPAPTIADTTPQTGSTITHASTSAGSRYSADSHNHNTDETLQRIIKGMGFNSVQTKVIATRLDHQLQSARNLQAPSIHTQANQNVVMEELNGQVRLSVQDASGHTLYGTNWFAREIGFRNFQPRK